MKNNQVEIGQAVPYKTVTKYIACIEGGSIYDRVLATGRTYYAYPFDNKQEAVNKMNDLYKQIKKTNYSVTRSKRKRKKCFFYLWIMTFKFDIDPWYDEC